MINNSGFLPSPYSNPTIWAGEVNIYVIEILKLLSRKLELQATNLIEDFRLNKETQSDEDEGYYDDDPQYSPTYYDVYEGIDGITFAIDDLFEDHLPSLIRCSAFVTIYSSMEVEIKKLCHILQVKENYCVKYCDQRSNGLIGAFDYLEKIAGLDINKSSTLWERFKAINEIRNKIVHENGKVSKAIIDSCKKLNIPGIRFKYDQKLVIKEGCLEYVIDLFSEIVELFGKKLCEKYPD